MLMIEQTNCINLAYFCISVYTLFKCISCGEMNTCIGGVTVQVSPQLTKQQSLDHNGASLKYERPVHVLPLLVQL